MPRSLAVPARRRRVDSLATRRELCDALVSGIVVPDPDAILHEARRTLDLGRPVALMLLGILVHLPSYDAACAVVRRLIAALSPGSYLVVCDGVNTNEVAVAGLALFNEHANVPYELRSPVQIAGYFEGLEVVPPGVVSMQQWRPDLGGIGSATGLDGRVGVGRKP